MEAAGVEDGTPHVVVAVRFRPLNSRELAESSRKVVSSEGAQLVLNYGDEEQRFLFDHVLNDETTQASVFQAMGQPLVERAFDGYNSTIFAYGQTGSGKTYTMLNVGGAAEELGLIPRLSQSLFVHLAEARGRSTTNRFLVQCSFLEIYNEVIYDLLVPSRDKGKGLEIREQKGLGVYVKDLTLEVVPDATQLDRLIHEGFAQRTTAATEMNDASSRSHCVFTIYLHFHDDADSSRNTISKLHLVDLAGSEKTTQQKENANINKSLSALGNVINALSTTSRRKAFVPYRDSKLTRVLQESLGGNAFCTMIATISPAEMNLEETWSTLQYAKRAKTIRVTARRNEESKQREELLREVEELRKMALEAGSTEEMEARHRAEIEALETFMKQTWEDKQRLSKEHEEQRELARLEVQRAREQRREEQRRRLDALTKLADLNVTLQSFMALGYELPWPARLAALLRVPQQVLTRQQAVRLYREGALTDLHGAEQENDAAMALLLSQASAKLRLMATELQAVQEAQRDYKGQLCALSAEVAFSVREAKDQEVDEEVLGLLELVQTQLGEHYANFAQDVFKEAARLDLSESLPRLRRAEGLGAELQGLRPCQASSDALPRPLGLASRELADSSITASSHGHLVASARLQHDLLTVGWCPATSSDEYLEVDLGEERVVAAIALQGRVPASGRWRQTRSLLSMVVDAEVLASTEEKTFLRPPVRCVHEVAMALCKKGIFQKPPEVADYKSLTKEAKLDFLSRLIEETKKMLHGPTVEGLSESEGEEEVPRLRLTAQDILAGRNCGETNRMLQLMACRALGLGEAPHWTTSWRLQYLVDGAWQWHAEDLPGNESAEEARTVHVPPLRARRLRICPLAWHRRAAVRLEIFVLPHVPDTVDVFGQLQEQLVLAQKTLEELKRHAEVGMRQHELLKEQEQQVQGELQRQLEEAMAKVANSEAQLLQLKSQTQRLEAETASQREELAKAASHGAKLQDEGERDKAALEDLREQVAIICDERDVARAHEEELFYVISRKDEELLQARTALADLSQQLQDGQLADEAAELLSSEMAGCREELQELSGRCSHLEAENAELRAERERAQRKREKLKEQKHELQERLKESERFRQAARDRLDQVLQRVNTKRDSADLEELAKSMDEQSGKPQRSLQRSRTVGAIVGTGAAAAEALAEMRALEASLGSEAAILPVFGMNERAVSTPVSGRSGRSTISGPVTEAAETLEKGSRPSTSKRR